MIASPGFSIATAAARLRPLARALFVLAAVAQAAAPAHAEPDKAGYLALGDSVAFGFIDKAGYAYGNADNFVGYPDYAGRALELQVTNASCSGEATSSFISPVGADAGCRGYRGAFPLHVSYGSTQLSFATAFLAANKKTTKLVTIGLGANDGFLLQASCGGNPACVQAGLPAALAAIYANMNSILSNLKATGFKGTLMVVNYYSVDYSDVVQTGFTVALNQTLASVAAANGAVVADAFTAFKTVAALAGGKTCMVGLLNASTSNQLLCDVHPSQSGQQLLARTVVATYGKSGRKDN